MHFSSSMTYWAAPSEMACTGQLLEHALHFTHFSVIMGWWTCFGAFVFVIQINTYFIYIFVVGKFGLVPVARSRMKFIGGFGLLAPCETIVATYCELCVFLHFQVALEVVPVNRVLSLKTGWLLVARIQFDFSDLDQLRVEAW